MGFLSCRFFSFVNKSSVSNLITSALSYLVSVWIGIMLCLAFAFCIFFFFSTCCQLLETNFTVHVLFTHCSWDPRLLYSKKKIKNGSHGTIHTFKNYFVTVFSVFNFSKNKLYSNGPLMICLCYHAHCMLI